MVNWIKIIGKDSLVYGVGGVLSKVFGLISIPLLTRAFTPEVYGQIDLLLLIGGFFSIFLIMGTDSALSYYFYNYDVDKNESIVISTIFFWQLFWGTLCFTLFISLKPVINIYFFKNQISSLIFFLIALTNFIQLLSNQSTNLFRLNHLPYHFIFNNFLVSFISTFLALYLIYFKNYSIIAVFYGLFMSSIFSFIFSWYHNFHYLSFKAFNFKFLKEILLFSLPFLPEAFIWSFMTSMDRILILRILGPYDVGIYSLGAKIGLIVLLAVQTFRLAWLPLSMKFLKLIEGKIIFRLVSRYYILIGFNIVLILSAFSKNIIRILSTEEYLSAADLIGFFALQGVLSSYNLILGVGITKTKKTYFFPICLLIASIINLVLNIVLIPELGIFGAVISTVISYVVWNAGLLFFSEKLWNVKFPIFSIFFSLLITIIGLISLNKLNSVDSNYPLLIIACVVLICSNTLVLVKRKDISYVRNQF